MGSPDAAPSNPRPVRLGGGAVAAGGAALAALAALWRGLGWASLLVDDAFISLRYSARLLAGDGLTWDDHGRVEGYSNLLWVLASAALGALPIDWITAVRILGLGAAMAAAIALTRLAPSTSWQTALPGLVAALLATGTGCWAAWSVGGLEQPLLVALLLGALPSLGRVLDGERPAAELTADATRAGLLLGLACWTRPDPPLFVALAAAVVVLARGSASAGLWPLLAQICGIPAAAVLAQLGFRLAYYGDWLPNTARIKLGSAVDRGPAGLAELASFVQHHSPLLLAAAVAAIFALRTPRVRPLAALLVLWLLGWEAYVVRIGGDIFPAFRHHVVSVGFAAGLVALGLGVVVARWPRRGAVVVLGTLALVTFGQAAAETDSEELARARAPSWERHGLAVGAELRAAFGALRPLVAVDPAGAIPFAYGGPALDMLGLCDDHIARHGRRKCAQIGHDVADGGYVLDRAPDLIVFCRPRGGLEPCFPTGEEMVQDPRFARRYRPMRLAVPLDGRPDEVTLYVRRDGGALGPRPSAEGLRVPAWLLGGVDHAVTPSSSDGAGPALQLATDAQLVLADLALGPGEVRAEAHGQGEIAATIERQANGRATLRVTTRGPATLREVVVMPPR